MTSERITGDLLTEVARNNSEKLLRDIHIRGLLNLADIASRIPDVSKRYGKLFDGKDENTKNLMQPKKTLLASFAALESFSDLNMEELHKNGLIVPTVLMYRALACEWDDCRDDNPNNPDKAWTNNEKCGINAEGMWIRGLNLVRSNPNIYEKNKKNLTQDLERARLEYIFYEESLKNPEIFNGLNPFEKFVMALEMRKHSFGTMAKKFTRVFTKGVENPSLEKRMANATLALGVVDGFIDRSEDVQNGTMTEARAIESYAREIKENAYLLTINCIGNILAK